MIRRLLCLAALLLIAFESSSADPRGFRAAPMRKPRSPASADRTASLVDPRLIRNGPRDLPRLALTIDDGWVDDPALLEVLAAYGIKCTVFIPGKVADERPAFVRKLDGMGFEVANHGYSHHVITAMSDKQIADDLTRGQAAITRITGKTFPFFRPSGGKIDARALAVAAGLGYKVILWENDVLGYSSRNSLESQVAYVREHLRNGNIILSHFGASLKTARVLKVLIPELLDRGYEFVTLTELLGGNYGAKGN